VQNPLYSNLLSKNIKTKIYRTLILPVAWLDVRPGLSHLREDHRLRGFENTAQRKIYRTKRGKVTGVLKTT
jgi:hypothetical protein